MEQYIIITLPVLRMQIVLESKYKMMIQFDKGASIEKHQSVMMEVLN
jgi:hypothetical protein